MLTPHDASGVRWEGRCDGCLLPTDIRDGSREAVLDVLAAEGWELVVPDLLWCVACSRRAREPHRTTRRGVRRRR